MARCQARLYWLTVPSSNVRLTIVGVAALAAGALTTSPVATTAAPLAAASKVCTNDRVLRLWHVSVWRSVIVETPPLQLVLVDLMLASILQVIMRLALIGLRRLVFDGGWWIASHWPGPFEH